MVVYQRVHHIRAIYPKFTIYAIQSHTGCGASPVVLVGVCPHELWVNLP